MLVVFSYIVVFQRHQRGFRFFVFPPAYWLTSGMGLVLVEQRTTPVVSRNSRAVYGASLESRADLATVHWLNTIASRLILLPLRTVQLYTIYE